MHASRMPNQAYKCDVKPKESAPRKEQHQDSAESTREQLWPMRSMAPGNLQMFRGAGRAQAIGPTARLLSECKVLLSL